MPETTPADRAATTTAVVDLAGDALTRGEAFGAARDQSIARHASDWLKSLSAAGVGNPELYVARMLRDTDFMSAIRAHATGLLDEVHGIADGARLSRDLVLAAQFMDEEWAYRRTIFHGAPAVQKCSSVAISSRGPTWIGQNMDLGGWTDGHQVLLRIAPHADEPGALIFTIGGMIGLLGVNSRGLGVCVNSLPQLPSAREGLPVAFVIRKLLQAKGVEEAVEVVSAIPHATGQHYLIADPTCIRSFEASPAGVVEYRSLNAARVMHTNHPLVGETAADFARDEVNSVVRLRSLMRRLMAGEPGLDEIKAALSSSDDPDHPVCRVGSGGPISPAIGATAFTTGSMISALQHGCEEIHSWVSRGPPSLRGYTQVTLPGPL